MSISYRTQYGTAPARVDTFTVTEECLPTLTAEGYIHRGWVDFIGDPVVVGQTFRYSPTLTAVWEEAPAEPEEPTFDTTSFLSGLTMGLCGKGVPELATDMMLYNGVELPKLPEWGKTAYPYAVLSVFTKDFPGSGVYVGDIELCVCPYPLAFDGKNIVQSGAPESPEYLVYEYKPSAGDAEFGSGRSYVLNEVVFIDNQDAFWTNTDIINTDGSVFLAASEPVPIADTFTKGYLLGAELRSKRKPVPVAYLYNGVRLPKLPEWDRAAYPYAAISYAETAGVWYLRFLSVLPYFSGTEFYYGDNTVELRYYRDIDGWENPTERNPSGDISYGIMWASHNICSIDGSIYLAASDPVPVYE